MSRKYVFIAAAAAVVLGMFAVRGAAQRQFLEIQRLWHDIETNRRPPEGTEFIFARVRFSGGARGRVFGFRGLEGWAHDYPEAEEHILQVANEATGMNVTKESYVIVNLDSDEIFKYPFLYFSEVGEMNMNEREVANFREYLNRGGFAMVDDFDSQYSLDWFLGQMRMVFPDRNFVELTADHPIYHTFYEIPTLNVTAPYGQEGPPKFYGYLDERGRLCMIINHNNDLGDFWEWIDQPMYPLEPSTEGLRFGINYFLYSMTH